MRIGSLRGRRVASLAVIAALLSACGSTASGGTPAAPSVKQVAKPASKPTAKKPIVIGDLVSLTTSAALVGKEEQEGRQMAVKDINAAGGVDGRPLRLVTEDVAFNNQTAINAFQKVLGAHPSAILAPVWSNQALALEPLVKKAKIATLYAGSAGIVTKQGNPYFFRDLTDVSYSAPVLAKWFLGVAHASRPAIIYSNDAFGISLKNAVLAGLKTIGVKPVTMQAVDDSATNVSAQIAAIRQSGADALFGELVSTTPALVLRAAHQAGLHLPMMFANPILAQSVLKLVPAAAVQGVYVESNYALTNQKSAKVRAWVKRFQATYHKTPDWAQAVNYGAVQLLAAVFKQYGTSPAKVDKGLHAIHYQGLFQNYRSDGEGNLWHTDDVIRFGPNKKENLVKTLIISK